jgi:hypothetical protein
MTCLNYATCCDFARAVRVGLDKADAWAIEPEQAPPGAREGSADRLAAAGTPSASTHATLGRRVSGMTGPRPMPFRLGRLSPSRGQAVSQTQASYAMG